MKMDTGVRYYAINQMCPLLENVLLQSEPFLVENIDQYNISFRILEIYLWCFDKNEHAAAISFFFLIWWSFLQKQKKNAKEPLFGCVKQSHFSSFSKEETKLFNETTFILLFFLNIWIY